MKNKYYIALVCAITVIAITFIGSLICVPLAGVGLLPRAAADFLMYSFMGSSVITIVGITIYDVRKDGKDGR